ncbi:hypothetical protein [Paraburkholderia kururiensis]|uniref:hypothetical protein n=1 Tax=Paraburkholderia kururiensis TaxID=984307 RepID=UPI0006940B0E|nr:hypothetical protein [Paraburkholderia kururiensis]
MTIRVSTSSVLACALLATGLALSASSPAQSRKQEENACKGDAFHFCAEDIPNKQKIAHCLQSHYDELKPACQAMFSKPSQRSQPSQPVSKGADTQPS